MVPAAFILDCLLTITAVVGFLFNIYTLVSILFSKQLSRPTNVLIFHMSSLFTLLTLSFVLLSSPSLFRTDPNHNTKQEEEADSQSLDSTPQFIMGHPFCVFHGTINLLGHPLALWTVAGMHLDRFISIVHPLRYSSILTKRKCAFYLGLSWAIVLVACLPPMMVTEAFMTFRWPLGLCAPKPFGINPFYPVGYVALTLLIPLCVVTGVNVKITSIAQHHRFRIANALFGMTLGSAAQHMQTEGARVRDQQEKALKHFEGKNAIWTLSQLIGTLYLAYLPCIVITFYETIANEAAHPLALKATLLCLMTAPSVNSFLFGFRNKSVQMIVLNYMRKEFYKNEVQQEIRLRSPGQPSTRPSVTSIVGQITCQVPYLQRQVSVASLGPMSMSNNGKQTSPTALLMSGGRAKNLRKKAPMERHYSDLSWRISALTSNQIPPHKSESSQCVNQLSHTKPTLEVPLDDSSGSIINSNANNPDISTHPSGSERCRKVGNVNQSNRRRMSLNFQQCDQTTTTTSTINGVMTANKVAMLNHCNIEILDDSSGSDSEVEALLMGKSNSSATSASVKFTANFPSPTVISNVVRSMWNITTNNKMQGPKITITRAPTIDQSDLEFLYPIPDIPETETSTTSNNVVKQIPTSESPSLPESPIKIELNCFRIEDDNEEEENFIPDKVNPDDQEAVCSKSVQTDQNALNEKHNGYYNGLFGNICCEEVII